MLILLWNILVGFTLSAFIILAISVSLHTDKKQHKLFSTLVNFFIGVYGGIGFLQLLFYPIGGILADLRFGRYRTVLCSMFSLWATYIGIALLAVIYLANHQHVGSIRSVMGVVGSVPILCSIFGFTGFQANSVQFGLDQLLDAPSEELSLFLHWFVWMDLVGSFLVRIFGASMICDDHFNHYLSVYTPLFVVVVVTTLAVLTCCKRSWFHSEPCTQNPYGTVYNVLKYVAQHDKPVQRSAMTYCDDERPTRMEFAKERFGGPFTTETVEDVKTFLRILLMLVALGPVFCLHVANIYFFPLFGLHVGGNKALTGGSCDADWLLLQTSNLSYLVAIVILPFYIIFVHPCVPRYFPRILYRLGIGIALLVVSTASIFVLDITGHAHAGSRSFNESGVCLFLSDYRSEQQWSLDFYTPLLILPNLLTGLAVPFILITTLEFISAQSPHTMKGLLLGVFYGIRGFFIMLGCTFILPFTQEDFWKGYGNVANCGFYYYLVNAIFGSAGLVLFWLAARWYQNREREDRPYGPSYVDTYYSRVLPSPQEEGDGEGEGRTLVSQAPRILTNYGATGDYNNIM